MSNLAEWTDEQLEARHAALGEQLQALFTERSKIGIEQAKRRIAERYARWGNKKSDIQFDYDNEAEAQGRHTKELLR